MIPLVSRPAPDGNLWFTEFIANKIGRITPTGTITEFNVPTSSSDPIGITAGPDGNLWFTERSGNKLGRVTINSSGLTISPLSALPTITDPVIIDGYTQPGASPNTLADGDNAVLLIELNGASAPAGSAGLSIDTGGSTVEGLVINRFVKVADSSSPTGFSGGYGILITGSGASGNVVQGNFIGTDTLGTAGLGNQQDGVLIQGSSGQNTIGGTTARGAERHLGERLGRTRYRQFTRQLDPGQLHRHRRERHRQFGQLWDWCTHSRFER